MFRSALLASAVLLSGCSTNPITGRDQILALPAAQAAYADAGFALSNTAQRIAGAQSCERDCGSVEDRDRFAARVKVIGAELELVARDFTPELFTRISGFRIEVEEGRAGAASSASGRIVLGSGIAGWAPSDTVIAFLIAREMAHVIARHAEEDSGASLVFTALGTLLPGFNVLLRFVATTLGGDALKGSWEANQQREADEIAIALLERTGLSAPSIARGLQSEAKHARPSDSEWGARYAESLRRAALIATSPRYTVSGD